MNKKPFDHIENKIREATDNSNYAFNEQAWAKMEGLLDKDKKRKPFAWWWFATALIIVAGISTYFFTSHISRFTNEKAINTIALHHANTSPAFNQKDKTATADTNLSSTTTIDKNDISVNEKNSGVHQHSFAIQYRTKTKVHAAMNDIAENNYAANSSETVFNNEENTNGNDITSGKEEIKKSISTKDTIAQIVNATTETKKTIAKKDTTVTKATIAKNKNSIPVFYLIAAAGGDASSVRLFSFYNSTLTPRYGLGAGFQLNKKISIQTGFYAGHKKYIAGPGDYTPKEGSYLYNADITKVNANCLVYEIPITLRDNFIQHNKTAYYATAGITSFIMKNENYYYYYTYNNNAYQGSKIYTGNQNLFSVLSLSVGVERALNNRWSLLAEPSVNIPLSGVGEGNVKLYSTALLVGIKYQFFKK